MRLGDGFPDSKGSAGLPHRANECESMRGWLYWRWADGLAAHSDVSLPRMSDSVKNPGANVAAGRATSTIPARQGPNQSVAPPAVPSPAPPSIAPPSTPPSVPALPPQGASVHVP